MPHERPPISARIKQVRQIITLKPLRKRWREWRRAKPALAEIAKFPKNPNAPKHNLPGELIVSLTSYPARFGTLHLTIKSLLDQTVRPDRIILWIGRESIGRLPAAVTELAGNRFSIESCEDLRSFTKIIPALMNYPRSFIVVADDDIYYPEYWLERLVAAFDPDHPTIVYHRGHRPAYSADGRLAPYRNWQRDVADVDSLSPGTDVMPTGVGGVLYPPGSLPPLTTDVALFRQLSETCDDSWLYFMWRQTNWRAKRAPGEMPQLLEWPDSQRQSLWAFHRGGKKDEHLQALSDHFGTP